MKQKIFLVDYENVNNAGLIGAALLNKNDRVYVFYSVNARDVRMETVQGAMSSKARFKFFRLNRAARNALDFQLVLYLGSRIRKYGTKAEYYVVSKDNGYQAAIDFADQHFGVKVYKASSIKEFFEAPQVPRLLPGAYGTTTYRGTNVHRSLPAPNTTSTPQLGATPQARTTPQTRTIPQTKTTPQARTTPQPRTTPATATTTPTAGTVDCRIDSLVNRLGFDATMRSELSEDERVAVANILLTAQTEEEATESLTETLGGGRVHLILQLYNHYYYYMKFRPRIRGMREAIEEAMQSIEVLAENLQPVHFNQVSSIVFNGVNRGASRQDMVDEIVMRLGERRADLVPIVLECCEPFMEGC